MKSRATLTLAFNDAAMAQAIAESVARDDDRFIRTVRRGQTLSAEAVADGPMSLLHTLDDYLACISVAERTAEVARPPGRRQRHRGGTPASPAGSSPPGRRHRARRPRKR